MEFVGGCDVVGSSLVSASRHTFQILRAAREECSDAVLRSWLRVSFVYYSANAFCLLQIEDGDARHASELNRMGAILRQPRGEVSEPLSRWESKLLRDETWRENYNTYLSRSSVAGTANSVDHSLFQGGHTKYASIVENSFRMFALILVIFIQAGK